MNDELISETKFTKGAPKWLLKQEGLTQRQWKSMKRQQLKNLVRAMDDFNYGCAFIPSYSTFCKAQALIKEIGKSMRVKDWK